MKCETCQKKGEIIVEYTQISFCKKCYERLLFRRLKRWFRNNCVIDKKKTHVLLDDGSLGFLFLKTFFKKFFSFPGLKWETRKRVNSRMKNKIIMLPTTLTQESDRFIHAIMNDGQYSSRIVEEKESLKIFKQLTIFLDSDLKKWKRRRITPELRSVNSFIEEIVKRRPMTRFSIVKHLQEF